MTPLTSRVTVAVDAAHTSAVAVILRVGRPLRSAVTHARHGARRRSVQSVLGVTLALVVISESDDAMRGALQWLGAPKQSIDSGSYDLLLASLGAGVSAIVVLYFTAGAAVLTLLAPSERVEALHSFFDSRWIVVPTVLVVTDFVLLGLSPLHVRPYSGSIPVLLALGLSSLVAFWNLAYLLVSTALASATVEATWDRRSRVRYMSRADESE